MAEPRFAEAADAPPLYVLTGPLYERVMPSLPMPEGAERHRVPSGYWKVLATAEGRVSAFVFDQATPRAADCDFRASLEEVEIRADLTLFPRLAERAFTPRGAALGCGG